MTIEQLLGEEYLSGVKILSGQNRINQNITGVNIMDSLDIHKWIGPGELVLSSGFVFKDGVSFFCEVIENLASVKASGLLVKMHRYIDHIPQDAVELARQYDFVLLEAPADLKFRYVLSAIIDPEQTIQTAEEVQKTFSGLLLEEADRQTIVDVLSGYLETGVILRDDCFGQTIVSKANTEHFLGLDDAKAQDCLKQAYCIPIVYKHNRYGELFILASPEAMESNRVHMLTLERAVSALQFSFREKLAARELEVRYAEAFLLDLLYGKCVFSREELEHKCRLHHLNYGLSTRIVVLNNRSAEQNAEQQRSLVMPYLYNALLQRYRFGAVTQSNDDMVMIVQYEGDDGPEKERLTAFVSEALHYVAGQFKITLGASIGSPVKQPLQYASSFRQALDARKISIKTGNPVLCYDDVPFINMLYAIKDMGESEMLVEKVLGKLIAYEQKNPGKELLYTLEILAEKDFNLRVTADTLFIHYNTLKYRYSKICALLDMDLSVFRNRCTVYIALLIKKFSD